MYFDAKAMKGPFLIAMAILGALWQPSWATDTTDVLPKTSDAPSDAPFAGTLSPFSKPADVRAVLATLTADQREKLRQKQQRFERLTREEQARVRQSHAELTREKDGERLHEVFGRYQQWLKTLSPATRADLSSLDSAERVEEIRKLRAEQERRRFVELGNNSQMAPQDAETVIKWLNEYRKNHAEELRAQIPREYRGILADPRRRIRVISWLLDHGKIEAPQPSVEEFDQLTKTVSKQMATYLGTVDPASRVELVREWSRHRTLSAMPPRPHVGREELANFLKDELSDDERERIERLPADRWETALRSLFFEKRFPDRARRRKGPSRNGSGRNGSGRNGSGRNGSGRDRHRGPAHRDMDRGGSPPPPANETTQTLGTTKAKLDDPYRSSRWIQGERNQYRRMHQNARIASRQLIFLPSA